MKAAKLQIRRREFLGGSLAAVAGLRVPRLRRPSDELRVAVVGMNGRGAQHVAALRAMPGVHVAALCDVDDLVLARELNKIREQEPDKSRRPGLHADLRYVLDRPDIDAVSIASPNHWHALQTIWACQAGKDVYVEKPVTHAFAEGKAVVAAARKHERIVQSGMQSRCSPALKTAIEWVRAGNLGAIQLVRGLCYKPRPSIGKVEGNQRVPESVDYDLWCGPAPLVPLRRKRLHYDWHWDFDTGDGDLGNQGVHQVDVARWVLGTDDLPASVVSLGGRLGYDDDGETPNTQLVFFAFEPAPMVFEVRGLPRDAAAQAGDWWSSMDDYLELRVGVVVHCTEGTLRIPSYSEAVAYDTAGKEVRSWEEGGDAFADWISAVRSRRVEDLSADIAVGVRSSALVHLANASQRLGRGVAREALFEAVASSPGLTSSCERMLQHLERNGVDLAQTKIELGPCLEIDLARGCAKDNPSADALLAGRFREPYRLPESG